MLERQRRRVFWLGVCAILAAPPVLAQERVGKDGAALTVDGVVRQVFRSPRQSGADVLVQIDVKRSEGRRVIQGPRPAFPGPGDTVYVHVAQPPAASGFVGNGTTAGNIPPERAQVRVFLTPRSTGGWEGVSGTWFELTSDQPAASTSPDPAPTTAGGPPDPAAAGPSLGMTLESMKVKDRLVLRVTSV